MEGSTALVAQTAFIMNDTVRENILFGSEYQEKLYHEVRLFNVYSLIVRCNVLTSEFARYKVGTLRSVYSSCFLTHTLRVYSTRHVCAIVYTYVITTAVGQYQ